MYISIYHKLFSRVLLPTFFILFMTGYAFAHKVTIFAWVEGDMVYTESKFSGGKKVKNAPVEVFDAHDTKLIEGKTDDNGEFSFKVPQKTEMKIVLLAGMGHKAQWTIPVEEFGEEIPENPEKTSASVSAGIESGESNSDKADRAEPLAGSNTPACLTLENIQDVVEKSLDKKLTPIITKLNKSLNRDHDPGVSDIFGGIGYILGLVGVGAYFNYRKKKQCLKND